MYVYVWSAASVARLAVALAGAERAHAAAHRRVALRRLPPRRASAQGPLAAEDLVSFNNDDKDEIYTKL
ncbi:unnamed protein product [Euphydryas editha]|uniref:Uncharacterized protein n=1 Tax=Euphydryas editha TaxID=104508 RepID=A0AAU9TD76_EUPED|nr:unnamed protein product [Euphydryas editha]